jgi:ABC-type multidrug transport system ATPase subunit
LDVTAEELVVAALTRLAEGRTVIMTTHQPALTRLATRIVYLHRGGVLEEAPPRPPGRRPAGATPVERTAAPTAFPDWTRLPGTTP